MSENVTTLEERKEGFDKLKPFLPSSPSKDWLSDHLTIIDILPRANYYGFTIDNILYPIAETSLYSNKEDFLDDIYHRWVKAAKKGELTGKKANCPLIPVENAENSVWVAKEMTHTSICSILSKCFPFLKKLDKKITWIK